MKAPWNALGFGPADLLLPRVPMETWSVIACDQYTSQPEYWDRVTERVGSNPSAMRLILPEYKLDRPDTTEEITRIHAAMEEDLASDRFVCLPESLIYVERRMCAGGLRRGVVGVVDLEQYDYRPGSKSSVRATEETVLSRVPPRAAVRRGAALELSHVMLLTDDPDRSVIEPLTARKGGMTEVYDFDLMENGGHITGWRLDPDAMADFAAALSRLGCGDNLRFAVGDGNHSLAAAKAVYEEQKGTPRGERLRYAMVELVNLYEDSLCFSPIHRFCSGVDADDLADALLRTVPGAHVGDGRGEHFTLLADGKETAITVSDPPHPLAVGTVQSFLDEYIPAVGGKIDYIHGDDVLRTLCEGPNTVGFLLPAMDKGELFPAIRRSGVLPRKTFSMGLAEEKRFYLEARRLR